MTIRMALLFDIDGTMADTDDLHLEAFNQTFAPLGHVFDRARFSRELQGFSMASIRERFLAAEPAHRQLEIMESKETVFRDLASGHIKPMPGLLDLLDFADSNKILMTAVTNAPRLNAEMMLSGLAISHRFRALVIGDELAHGKPHPLPYVEGLRAVGASPAGSLAFEDSRSGIQSAVAAGLSTIGLQTSLSHADMIAEGATLTAKTFEDPELWDLVREKLKRTVA